MFTFKYVFYELIVFIIEALLYTNKLNKISSKHISTIKLVLYALVANTASYGLGLWLSHIIPGIF